jgi:hypothetical protein
VFRTVHAQCDRKLRNRAWIHRFGNRFEGTEPAVKMVGGLRDRVELPRNAVSVIGLKIGEQRFAFA